jgi:hypothetical protein
VKEELRFIRQKITGSRYELQTNHPAFSGQTRSSECFCSLRDHAVQLAAAWLVTTAMHVVLNTFSHRLPLSSHLFSVRRIEPD